METERDGERQIRDRYLPALPLMCTRTGPTLQGCGQAPWALGQTQASPPTWPGPGWVDPEMSSERNTDHFALQACVPSRGRAG